MNPFFITGLPRSRSAWLANWLTTDKSLCYHDRPFHVELLKPGKQVGFSGPEMVTQFDELRKAYPAAHWLLVERDDDDALLSFYVWAKLPPAHESVLPRFWEQRKADLAKVRELGDTARIKRVPFDKLDEENTAREVWSHLLPSVPMDVDRWNVLRGLNVQQQRKESWLLQR